MFATIAMALFLILFMFLVIMFIVYLDYMLGIARIIIVFMHKFAKHSLLSTRGEWSTLCKRGAYTLFTCVCTIHFGLVVDHEGDSFVESFVVHLPSVRQVGRSCDGSQALFLIFFSNVPYV
jgi:hypothetical protein